MIWDVIKKSGSDIWDEILYLIIFNVIWLLGTILVIPYPFVTFGLFFTVRDIGQGKGIKFVTFFAHAYRMWKQAYIWGGINLFVLVILGINIKFYADFANAGAQWAALVQLFILGLTFLWGILQLVALPLYPRLEEPGFKMAIRNAAILAGRYPLAMITLVVVAVLILVISYIFPIVAVLLPVAVIAAVANRMVEAMVKKELKDET